MRSLVALLLGGVLAAPAFGQPAPGDYRIEPLQAGGPAGVLRLDGSRYDRRTGRDLGSGRSESGEAQWVAGRLLTRSQAAAGAAGHLLGRSSATASRGLYAIGSDGGLEGVRVEAGGALVRERLVPLAADQAGNAVRLLVDGESFAALEAGIAAAHHTIILQLYQWTDDATGQSLVRALAARARAGVRVRVLLDARSATLNRLLGKPDVTRRLQAELEAAGVDFRIQNRFASRLVASAQGIGRGLANAWRRLRGRPPQRVEERGLKAGDHRKLVVIDGRVAYCGGQNVGDVYQRDWHDAQVRVEGPAAHVALRLIDARWRQEGGGSLLAEHPDPAPWAGDVAVEVVTTTAGVSNGIKQRVLAELAAARRQVLIEDNAFLDEDVHRACAAAVRRGVRVVVIVSAPERTENPLAREAFAWVQDAIVRSGVELYHHRRRLIHGKIAVFDGRLATVGSSNLLWRHLAEVNLFVPDWRFAREVERRIFQVDLPECERVQVKPRGAWSKVKGFTLKTLHALL